ncbi:hypothetical protein RB213_015173 [Colletotrichum asianum]
MRRMGWMDSWTIDGHQEAQAL